MNLHLFDYRDIPKTCQYLLELKQSEQIPMLFTPPKVDGFYEDTHEMILAVENEQVVGYCIYNILPRLSLKESLNHIDSNYGTLIEFKNERITNINQLVESDIVKLLSSVSVCIPEHVESFLPGTGTIMIDYAHQITGSSYVLPIHSSIEWYRKVGFKESQLKRLAINPQTNEYENKPLMIR